MDSYITCGFAQCDNKYSTWMKQPYDMGYVVIHVGDADVSVMV